MDDRMISHLKKIIPFIIIALLAGGGVEAFYRITFNQLMQMSRPPKIENATAKVAAPIASIEKKRPDSQAILKRNLFGPPPKAAKPAITEQAAPLAATSLDLSLLGTITGPPTDRRAIILDKKKKLQDIYYQGDMVQGALIKEIQRGKIILNRNGKDEILVPETPKKNTAAATYPAYDPQMPPETAQEAPPLPDFSPGILPGIVPEEEQPKPLEPEAVPTANNATEPN
jgi:type II secretory pathway component PulC